MSDTPCDCGFCDRCLQQWHEEARAAIQEDAALKARVKVLMAEMRIIKEQRDDATEEQATWEHRCKHFEARVAELEARCQALGRHREGIEDEHHEYFERTKKAEIRVAELEAERNPAPFERDKHDYWAECTSCKTEHRVACDSPDAGTVGWVTCAKCEREFEVRSWGIGPREPDQGGETDE